jgi:hypothetical protein
MREMGCRLSHLPRTSYTAGACSLGHRACNACPFGLALFADVGLFSVASPLPPLMLASGFAAPWPRSFDRAGPMRPHWASLATGLGKADGEPRMARVVPAVRPYVAHGATRTGDTLGVPSHRNTREGKALPRVRLPGRLPLDRPHDCDAVVGLTGDEDWGGRRRPGRAEVPRAEGGFARGRAASSPSLGHRAESPGSLRSA